MYCSKCGAKLSDDAKFCSVCGNLVKTTAKMEVPVNSGRMFPKPSSKKKKWPVFVAIPLIFIVLFSLFHLFQFRGYKSFVGEYFTAMESGNTEKILKLYNWDYVDAENKQTVEKYGYDAGLLSWTYDTLEDYVYNNDNYYRHLAGKKIESWKITDKKYAINNTHMQIEVYVVYEGNSSDVIALLDMRRGNDGWYMTSCYAGYATD